MRIEIVQSKNYAETIMELKNRALLIGVTLYHFQQ